MNVKEQSVPGFKLEEESHAAGEEENNTVVMHCVGGRERLLGNLKSMSSRQRLIVVNFGNTVTPGRNNLEEERLFGSQFPSIQSLVDKKGGHTMVTAKKKEKIGDHITSKETLTHTHLLPPSRPHGPKLPQPLHTAPPAAQRSHRRKPGKRWESARNIR